MLNMLFGVFLIFVSVIVISKYREIYLWMLNRADSKLDKFVLGPFWYFEVSICGLALMALIAGIYNVYIGFREL